MTWAQAKLVGYLAGGAIIAALLVALVMSWMSRGQEIARLKDWQNAVVISATDATVKPDAKGVRKPLVPEQVPAAIAALKRSLDSATGSLDRISADAKAAKERADKADAALATATAAFEQRYQSAEKRIAALDARKPAADPVQQCANIAADSKAAWEGWK